MFRYQPGTKQYMSERPPSTTGTAFRKPSLRLEYQPTLGLSLLKVSLQLHAETNTLPFSLNLIHGTVDGLLQLLSHDAVTPARRNAIKTVQVRIVNYYPEKYA
jgi:hypothetical protein